MIKLGDVLKDIFSESPYKKKIEEATVLAVWEKAVGEHISRYTRATFIKDGVLFVKVFHPAWRQELYYRKKEILKKLHQHVSKETIKDIRFK